MAPTQSPDNRKKEKVVVTGTLASRLEQIPGVASVTIDLTDTGGGINVRLEPTADEFLVMDKLREVLITYGIRSADPKVQLGRSTRRARRPTRDFDVDVVITPLKTGARVEVFSKNVRSFRVVPANPSAIAQGLSDAWCQVKGRIPVEILDVTIGDDGDLSIVASDGVNQTTGTANVSLGWEEALTQAVGEALWSSDGAPEERPLASNSS